MSNIPKGFELFDTESPFIKSVGPFYYQQREQQVMLGLLVGEQHCNRAGKLHGGMICTIADIAIGNNIGIALAEKSEAASESQRAYANGTRGASIATVSLNTDFAGTANIGDWVEVSVDVQRAGRSLAFANAYLFCGDERIARVSAVFKVLR
ncbi:MAG: PaaI family thioesterase [Pseudomonadota bacterium]